MELFVRESRVAEVLAAEFPNPTPDMADEIRRLQIGGDQCSALLDVWLTVVPDDQVHDALRYVRAGAEFLDDNVPGWRDRIDVSVLDISSPRKCVLGQLYSQYTEGKRMLLLDFQAVVQFGFLAWPHGSDDALSAAWREILTATVPA